MGELYQWGRWKDGHQYRESTITTNQSADDTPGHSDFITGHSDWRTTQNNNLWQGVDGINNPCPTGFRLPTKIEWETEINSWVSQDAAGAFSSPLKLVLGGRRLYSNGNIFLIANTGYYWTSTVDTVDVFGFNFDNGDTYMDPLDR